MTGQPDALREAIAEVIEDQAALGSGGNDQQDRYRALEIADAVIPVVRAHFAAVLADEVTVEAIWIGDAEDEWLTRSDIAHVLAALLPILTGAPDDVPRVLQ